MFLEHHRLVAIAIGVVGVCIIIFGLSFLQEDAATEYVHFIFICAQQRNHICVHNILHALSLYCNSYVDPN
jgi:hypothetical protein